MPPDVGRPWADRGQNDDHAKETSAIRHRPRTATLVKRLDRAAVAVAAAIVFSAGGYVGSLRASPPTIPAVQLAPYWSARVQPVLE